MVEDEDGVNRFRVKRDEEVDVLGFSSSYKL